MTDIEIISDADFAEEERWYAQFKENRQHWRDKFHLATFLKEEGMCNEARSSTDPAPMHGSNDVEEDESDGSADSGGCLAERDRATHRLSARVCVCARLKWRPCAAGRTTAAVVSG